MSQPKSNEGYKNTAERYVREQLPELMELSSYSTPPNAIYKHEPQLQHWLECIRQNVGRKVYMSLHTLEIEDSGFYMQFDKDTGQPATENDYKAFCEIVGITSEDKN